MSSNKFVERRPAAGLPPDESGDSASLLTHLGWVAMAFAAVPLLMAAHGDGRSYLLAGASLAMAGLVLIVAGRIRRGRR